MKRKIKHRLLLIGLLLGLVGTQNCSDLTNNPLKDKDTGNDITLLLLDPNFFDSKFTFEFVDYSTGQVLEGTQVGFMLIGDRVNDLVTIGGEIKESHVIEAGFFELFLDPNKNISVEYPVSLSAYAWNENYLSLPLTIETTQEGNHVYQVQMVPLNQKSASVYQDSEPYQISISGSTTPSIIPINTTDNGFSIHSLFTNEITSGGSPDDPCSNPFICAIKKCCKDVTGETINLEAINLPQSELFTHCGFVEGGTSFKNQAEVNPSTIFSLEKNQSAYSISRPTGLNKCDAGTGLTLEVKEANNAAGSGRFYYTIKFSNNTSVTGWFEANFKTMSTTLIENLYYPAQDPAVEVSLQGDGQYDISPATISLATPCNTKASFTATPKSNLTHYHMVGKYYCLGASSVGITPSQSFSFRFRKKGLTLESDWTQFLMVEGVSDIWLERGTLYEFAISTPKRWEAYELPTSKDQIESFLANLNSDKFQINKEDLSIDDKGDIVNITVKVGLKEGICGSLGQ